MKNMTVKEWNGRYTGMPCNHGEYTANYIGFVMYNDSMGQCIVFESPVEVVLAIKQGGLYNVRDRYLYFDGRNVIGFNSNDDATAPWNYMDWLN
jgi:hypothetical protein